MNDINHDDKKIAEDIKFIRTAIDWRRNIVLQKLAKGWSQSDIARELKLHPSTISLDVQYLKTKAQEELKAHIKEVIPFEYQKSKQAISDLIKKANEILENNSEDPKLQLSVINVLTNLWSVCMSTWLLYWILFKSLREWKPGDMAILITGNALRLSQDLISRYKRLTQQHFPEVYSELMEQSSTEATIAGVKVIGLPSRFAALRGFTGVRAIVSDENDYWPISEQREMQSAIEPFYTKANSNAWILLVSTPASGFGIMRQLETTPNSPYYSCVFDYTYGLEGSHPIYDKTQLDHIKNTSPDSWAREFLCQYTNIEGSVYDTSSIERALAQGDKYMKYTDPANWLKDTHTVIALDPAWGNTSKYGIVIIQWIDQKAVVVHAKEYHFGNFSDMITEMFRLRSHCRNVSCFMVDSSAPEVINTLRREMQLDKLSERTIKDIIASCRASNTPLERRLKVVPRFFNIEGRQMLQKSVAILSSPDSYVAIPRKFSTLVQALQGATAFEWKLDKTDGQSGLDVLDAFIMGLSYFRLSDK